MLRGKSLAHGTGCVSQAMLGRLPSPPSPACLARMAHPTWCVCFSMARPRSTLQPGEEEGIFYAAHLLLNVGSVADVG